MKRTLARSGPASPALRTRLSARLAASARSVSTRRTLFGAPPTAASARFVG